MPYRQICYDVFERASVSLVWPVVIHRSRSSHFSVQNLSPKAAHLVKKAALLEQDRSAEGPRWLLRAGIGSVKGPADKYRFRYICIHLTIGTYTIVSQGPTQLL